MERHDFGLDELQQVVHDRKLQMPDGSYTASLFRKGLSRIAEKIDEESGEVIQALESETADRVNEEVADLVFHITVGMEETGKGSWAGVIDLLRERRAGGK